MKTRRHFLKQTATAVSLLAGVNLTGCALNTKAEKRITDKDLKSILHQPVLRRELFSDPVIIESVDLLRNGKYYTVRVRSTDGAEGFAIANEAHMRILWPVFLKKVAPFFTEKDARDLDLLVEDCFRADSSYKYQSLAIWLPIASVEFAILDLLGQMAGQPVGSLVGEVLQTSIDVYRANNFRGRSAEESVERIVAQHIKDQSRAVKFKVGGRMNLPEEPQGRSERLIPMVREALGDDITIYSDANGSYDVEEAIRIGKMLEDIDAAFYEEPCPFDHLWETKAVADALTVPIAGGEQESSMRRFQWMIASDAIQIAQPDLLYFGGLIRSIKVARMAQATGKLCTPHMSGAGLGSLYVLHYASVVPNAGPYQEYKGANKEIPFESTSVSLEVKNGQVPVPTGAGLGVQLDSAWIDASELLTLPSA